MARKGRHLTLEHRRKIGRSGTRNWAWRGSNASYWAIHIWVNSHLDDPGRCAHCGVTTGLHWSNKDHRYRRVPEDWQRLCAKCHRRYDDIFNPSRGQPWNKGLKLGPNPAQSERMRGRVPWNKGKTGLYTHTVSEETRRKISEANKGRKPSPLTIQASIIARKKAAEMRKSVDGLT